VRRTGEPCLGAAERLRRAPAAAPYFIAQIQDITEARRADELRAQAAAELERSNAALEDLAHIAAHDLRTPLQTISGFTELLLRRHGGALPGEAAEFAQLILESARRSGELLDNLLSYARAGGAAGARETVDPGAVVAEVLARCARRSTRGRPTCRSGRSPRWRRPRPARAGPAEPAGQRASSSPRPRSGRPSG
jgi:signal transduction histidine kinase